MGNDEIEKLGIGHRLDIQPEGADDRARRDRRGDVYLLHALKGGVEPRRDERYPATERLVSRGRWTDGGKGQRSRENSTRSARHLLRLHSIGLDLLGSDIKA